MTTQQHSPDDRRIGVHVSLSRNEQADLAALAEQLDCSRSEVIRRGIALIRSKANKGR